MSHEQETWDALAWRGAIKLSREELDLLCEVSNGLGFVVLGDVGGIGIRLCGLLTGGAG